MKNIIIGTLAHVDAGKTTLTESMLYTSKDIRKLGRVDHGDAFLDYDYQERKRGITIYSKQAMMTWSDMAITLIDTPGHVDFSSEMERTLQVLDYAILVINAIDGIQTHTETIWKLLEHYKIPTFIFVNKMDIAYKNEMQMMLDIKEHLHQNSVNFNTERHLIAESAALLNDVLLEQFIENDTIKTEQLAEAIHDRKIFPCFFGSALKMKGIENFLDGLQTYIQQPCYPVEFGAKVYKITRDEQGNRLTHMKITSGKLKVKTRISETDKIDQIRVYSGHKFTNVQEIHAGYVCAVKGLRHFYAGDGLGMEEVSQKPLLNPYMNYRILLPRSCDVRSFYKQLCQLKEEDPLLHISYHEVSKEICLQVMGEIQIDILKNIIQDRFHIAVQFEQGSVNYKETIIEPVIGVGHFEPLQHYAEVHLLLEPGKSGSGLQYANTCCDDMLDTRYQKLIMTHVKEKIHIGVLSGSPITDMKITLLGGKAHVKHTEGGDFREATYRAVRHGLKQANAILLEPYYQFELILPDEYISKAIFDIERMHGTFEINHIDGMTSVIVGNAPVSFMQNYQVAVRSYTKGKGTLNCKFKEYKSCIKQEELLAEIGYDSEADIHNPTGSIFCQHGAGFYVKWDEVEKHMHVKNSWLKKEVSETQPKKYVKNKISDDEVQSVFNNIYRTSKDSDKQRKWKKKKEIQHVVSGQLHTIHKPECLLVDGYNIIHSWDELKKLAQDDLDAARMRLINIMSNYQGYRKKLIIIVFDAYKVIENSGNIVKHDNLYVVYTKTRQTADSYIEETTHKMASEYVFTVATSDALEQWIITGQGANRMSARELALEVDKIHKISFKEYESTQKQFHNFALEDIRTWNDDCRDKDEE